MNFQFYLEKLFDSEEFQDFIKENKDAYPCSGFIVCDFEGKDNKTHFDYYVPSVKKMFSFKLEDNCAKIPVEIIPEEAPKRLKFNYSFHVDDIQKLVENKMLEESIKNKLQKMLFSLQNIDGKDFLVGTVFISSLGMLKVNIDLDEMKITDFKKHSFMEMINVFKKKEEDKNG